MHGPLLAERCKQALLAVQSHTRHPCAFMETSDRALQCERELTALLRPAVTRLTPHPVP